MSNQDSTDTAWIALLVPVGGHEDPDEVTSRCRLLVDEVSGDVPDGMAVTLIDPSTDASGHAGVKLSGSEQAGLVDWIARGSATESIAAVVEAARQPVTIISQGTGTAAEFPVSYVVTYSIPVANRARFQEWQPRIIGAHLGAEGFVSAEYHPPQSSDDSDDTGWTVLARFASEADVTAWRNGPVRAELIGELETMAEDFAIRSTVLTWAGWIPQAQPAAHRPPRWKQALVTVVPLYPTVMLASVHLAPRLGSDGWGWPRWLVTFVVVGTAVTTLTWLLMPNVTRVLKPWLLAPPAQTRRFDLTWLAAVLAVLAALLLVFGLTT